MTYFETLVFTTVSPIVVGVAVYVVFGVRQLRAPSREAAHQIYAMKFYILMVLSFCVLTSGASTTLRYFGCARYDLGDYEPGGAPGTWRRNKEALWILNADPTIRCYGSRHRRWSAYVGLMIAVYPLGIPLYYFVTLWKLRHLLNPQESDLDAFERDEIDDDDDDDVRVKRGCGAPAAPDGDALPEGFFDHGDEADTGTRLPRRDSRRSTKRCSVVVQQQRHSLIRQAKEDLRAAEVQAALMEHRDLNNAEAVAHVSFLVEEYEPRCYLFSVFECMRRIAMTGGLTVFANGGALQISMGLLLAIISHRVYSAFEPYIEDDDDTLSEVAQTQLVFTFFGALLLYIEANTEGERGYANDIFAGALALVMFSGVLCACYYVLLDAVGRDVIEKHQDAFRQRVVSVASVSSRHIERAISAPRAMLRGMSSRSLSSLSGGADAPTSRDADAKACAVSRPFAARRVDSDDDDDDEATDDPGGAMEPEAEPLAVTRQVIDFEEPQADPPRSDAQDVVVLDDVKAEPTAAPRKRKSVADAHAALHVALSSALERLDDAGAGAAGDAGDTTRKSGTFAEAPL